MGRERVASDEGLWVPGQGFRVCAVGERCLGLFGVEVVEVVVEGNCTALVAVVESTDYLLLLSCFMIKWYRYGIRTICCASLPVRGSNIAM